MKKEWCTITIETGHKVKIDREDLDVVTQHKWRATTGSTGRLRVVTSVRHPEGSRSITLGRFLLKPSKQKQVYPRRFNDGLDYRKDNLVVCTMKERQRLISKRRTNTSSPYKGVSFLKSKKKWRAGIEVNGRAINLGDFAKENEAALAYNVAARKYFGDIAYQNQIQREPQRKNDSKKKKKS